MLEDIDEDNNEDLIESKNKVMAELENSPEINKKNQDTSKLINQLDILPIKNNQKII